MPDKYDNFTELEKAENPKNYRIRALSKRAAVTAVIAIHGGGIEPGTSEIAEAIADKGLSFYAFEGRKKHNKDLHITSTHFREPKCVALIAASERVIAIHGQCGSEDVVLLGGLDEVMKRRLRKSLEESGFPVQKLRKGRLEGRHANNICNRGMRGEGVQMELSEGMRRTFFKSLRTRRGRQIQTRRFEDFVAAVRRVIAIEHQSDDVVLEREKLKKSKKG
jgi:phage replication-related protein YjqB (UPF0714/DUF867 family)